MAGSKSSRRRGVGGGEREKEGRDSYLLIGESVSDSPSPAMMNHAFKAMDLRATYEARSIENPGLSRFVSDCKRRNNVAGLNVTMPFKMKIVPLLDAVEEDARRVGAVNTVKREEDSSYVGYNTDIEGIVRPLRALGIGAMSGRGAAVIGAGGAARAFVGAMHSLGCSQVSVIARRRARGRIFVEELGEAFPGMNLRTYGIASEDLGVLKDLGIVFNAAPIGGDGERVPREIFALLKGAPVVFDAVYRPIDTELLLAARRGNCTTVPGYEMLLAQGVAAIEIWTGKRAPQEVMRKALLSELAGATRR